MVARGARIRGIADVIITSNWAVRAMRKCFGRKGRWRGLGDFFLSKGWRGINGRLVKY